MIKYDPNNELTEEQMKELSEDDFFAYLDAKSAYLKQNAMPLDQYHVKRFSAMANGGNVTTKDLKRAKEIGREGEAVRNERIKEAAKNIKVKEPDLYIKNHKTHRSQWFD